MRVDNGYRYNSHNIGCKAWPIVIKVLTLVVVLKRGKVHILESLFRINSGNIKSFQNHSALIIKVVACIGFQHWKDDSTVSCKSISPINFRSFIQTIWYN